jgi:zinc protease
MRRFPLAAALAALLALPGVLPAAPIPFPQAESDLRPDPAVTYGTLPNGVRYVVMPNHEPKGRASLRLLVLAGSFMEKENQRGLAHFLEHMAFNGSTHYPPGTLVEKLQRLGMGFGADTNAATSFDHTIYQLELPDTQAATLAEGLQILADYSGGLLLEPKMVDKERGIILSEQRTRDSVGYRSFVAQMNFMEDGTRVPERLPIGLTDVIQHSNRDPFVDFYNTWYRPERLVVIVVGDIEPAAIEQQIKADFSGLAARAPEAPEPDLGAVATFNEVRTRYHAEPEAPDTDVVIASTTPYAHEPDNTANRIKYLPRYLAIDMLNQRLDVITKTENSPFIRATANVEESFNLYRAADISVACKPGQWDRALNVADQELRRALDFGFRPDEFKEAVADFRNNVVQAVKTESTRRSDALAGDIADNLVERGVYTSPDDDLKLYGAALDHVTAADCVAALRDAWSAKGRYVYVGGNAVIGGVPELIIKDAYARAEGVDVHPMNAQDKVSWGYSDFGSPGKVAARSHIDDLDITEVTFANGVRLNLKKTAFEANTIHVAARLGTGQLTEPAAAEPGLSIFTSVTYTAGGLGKHSVDDLQRILAGKTVGAAFSSTPDAFEIQGTTNREDLGLEFQLLTAEITDPGYRPEALRVARKKIEDAYISFAHTEKGPMTLHVARLVVNDDPRFGLPAQNEMMSRTLREEKEWLAPQLKSGALEVSLVGDFDVDYAIAAAAATVGTLPPRDPRPALADRLKVSFPAHPFTKEYGIDTKIPKGVVGVYWPTTDGLDVHRKRRLSILGEVLNDRLRVRLREQLGGTYAPNVLDAASDLFPGYGYLAAITVVEPSRAKEIQDSIVTVAWDLYTKGVTADELARTVNPVMTQIRETERSNLYWMTVLGRAQEKPAVLDWARGRREDYQSITTADLDALAKLYLSPDNASRVMIRPYASPAGSGPLMATPTPTPPPDGM